MWVGNLDLVFGILKDGMGIRRLGKKGAGRVCVYYASMVF
jgi:hypothetical protein